MDNPTNNESTRLRSNLEKMGPTEVQEISQGSQQSQIEKSSKEGQYCWSIRHKERPPKKLVYSGFSQQAIHKSKAFSNSCYYNPLKKSYLKLSKTAILRNFLKNKLIKADKQYNFKVTSINDYKNTQDNSNISIEQENNDWSQQRIYSEGNSIIVNKFRNYLSKSRTLQKSKQSQINLSWGNQGLDLSEQNQGQRQIVSIRYLNDQPSLQDQGLEDQNHGNYQISVQNQEISQVLQNTHDFPQMLNLDIQEETSHQNVEIRQTNMINNQEAHYENERDNHDIINSIICDDSSHSNVNASQTSSEGNNSNFQPISSEISGSMSLQRPQDQ